MAAKTRWVKRYVVRLSAEERQHLEAMMRKGKSPAQRLLKARILLKADVSDDGEGWSDSRIIEALETSVSMVYRVRKQLVEEGLEAVLRRRAPASPAVPRIIAATTHRPTIASRSLSQPRSDALPNTSSANCVAARLSSRSSATPKASVAWAAITSQASRAMRPTPSLPPRDTTSEDCWLGSSFGCRHSCSR